MRQHLCFLSAGAGIGAAFVASAALAVWSGDQVLCAVDRPCINNIWQTESTIHVGWSASEDFDAFNVRWSRPGREESQSEVSGGRGGEFKVDNVHSGVVYTFKVQGCKTRFLSSSRCTPWEEQSYTAANFGADTCLQGFVWREAFAGDHVCVTPQMRAQAAADNAAAGARRQPGGGASGPDTCRQGFVWRDARPGDHVCVTPDMRAQAAADNAAAASRRAAR